MMYLTYLNERKNPESQIAPFKKKKYQYIDLWSLNLVTELWLRKYFNDQDLLVVFFFFFQTLDE